LVGTGVTSGEQLLFSSIPQTYQDLMLVVYGTQTNTAGSATIAVNGLTGTPYSQTILTGDGATLASTRIANTNPGSQLTHANTTIPVTQIHHILNYTNTSCNKTILTKHAHDKNGSGISVIAATLVRTTNAVTSVLISSNWSGSFWGTDATATLYGIKAGI
jgi:hypothetical protein